MLRRVQKRLETSEAFSKELLTDQGEKDYGYGLRPLHSANRHNGEPLFGYAGA